MLHFCTNEAAGHPSIWGVRVLDAESDFESDIARLDVKVPRPMVGQRLGGIGFYRNETGQPRFNDVQGAYAFDTYLTTYVYADGQYSLAVQTFLTLAETLNIGDVAGINKNVEISLADGVSVGSSVGVQKIAFVALTEALTLHDAISQNVVVSLLLSESLLLSDSVLSGTPLLSYVINMTTNALVKYSGFNFNSYANLNGKHYGMLDTGLHELVGESDNGTVIQASLTLGKQDFGSKQLKQIPLVHIGAMTDGELIMRVLTDSGENRYYRMNAPAVAELKTHRIALGKGVKSRYWQFELQNVAGSDLDLDSISFKGVVLARRIGGRE